MALILCIETGTDICSVGIARDGELLSLRESDEGRDHARQVAVFVDELLGEMNLRLCILQKRSKHIRKPWKKTTELRLRI